MRIELIGKTNCGDLSYTKFLASIARRCYSVEDFENIKNSMTEEKAQQLIKKVIESGHLSILEHCSFTFSITDVPVSLMGQLTRHRLASFAVTSLRYNNLKIKKAKFIDLEIYPKDEEMIENHFELCLKTYNYLIDKGYKPEEARYVLPQGILTNVIMTMNVREIFHFLDLRNCNKADKPIHELARRILNICYGVDSYLFGFAKQGCWDCQKCEDA